MGSRRRPWCWSRSRSLGHENCKTPLRCDVSARQSDESKHVYTLDQSGRRECALDMELSKRGIMRLLIFISIPMNGKVQ